MSFKDGALLRGVKLSEEEHTAPTCYGYYDNGYWFNFLQGVTVLWEKHGGYNIHRFISVRHLTPAWCALYEKFSFQFHHKGILTTLCTKKRCLSLPDTTSTSQKLFLRRADALSETPVCAEKVGLNLIQRRRSYTRIVVLCVIRKETGLISARSVSSLVIRNRSTGIVFVITVRHFVKHAINNLLCVKPPNLHVTLNIDRTPCIHTVVSFTSDCCSGVSCPTVFLNVLNSHPYSNPFLTLSTL